MRSNKELGHTADVRLQVEGDTLKELFTAAVEGMAAIIKNDSCEENENHIEESILISSLDSTKLLIDFLSAILTKSHINETIYCRAEFHELSENNVKATIYGHKVEDFDEDIKAVTYHEADIQKNEKGNFETIILFDI